MRSSRHVKFELVDRPASSAYGQRPVGEHDAARLAARAIVALVLRVHDPLHRRAADRTRLAEASVDRHLGPKRSDVFGEPAVGLCLQALGPLAEDGAGGREESRQFVRGQFLGERKGRERARCRTSSE